MNDIPLSQADTLLARARRLLHDHRTRARKDGAEIDYTLRDLRELLASSPCCAYCGMPVAWDASIDHKTPTSRGGKHCRANLVVCCRACQERKGLLSAEEFRQLLALIGSWAPRAGSDLLARLRAGGGKRYGRNRTIRTEASPGKDNR